ncbi:hypothetical protein CK203_029089 [Vitis vinifera]|uniref:Ubiquitin-like protease family profile domain-containing protein n=1 Tax=Vitis vinifera TaxID=29760 RepID=A0A438IMZ7_VITVI|nr:hypothetical protein CK203_029089 [Vitis vinifera]
MLRIFTYWQAQSSPTILLSLYLIPSSVISTNKGVDGGVFHLCQSIGVDDHHRIWFCGEVVIVECAINPHRGCCLVLSIEEGASLTIGLMDASNRIYCYIFVGGKLVQKNDGQWNTWVEEAKMHYTLKFNPRVIQDLEDEDDLDNVVPTVMTLQIDPPITFPSSNASCDPIPKTMMLSRGFASRSADTEYIPLESIRFREAILGSGHTFKNAEEFRNAIYQMSLGGSSRCRGNVILRVHTYQVNHNHIAQDECSSKVKVSSKRGAVVVEDVFRTTPYYLPVKSVRILNVIMGLREINPGTIAEYTSQEGHFMQLFIAHAFSIQGFIMGCRPVLAIDSCHLSGPYKGALLSVIAYDADDGMFPLTLVCFFNKQNIRGKKGKEDALLLLDSIAYARLEIDYNEAFEKLVRFNENLAKWVAENNPEHWAMSKFLKKRWDKMTTNIAEAFNAWLREERHQTIYTLLLMHMDKLVGMLDTHMRGSRSSKVEAYNNHFILLWPLRRRIDITSHKRYDLIVADVGLVFGLPTTGRILHIATTPSDHPFGTLNTCEERLLNLPIGRSFIDASFTTLFHYIIKFKIPSVHVPMTAPLLSAWAFSSSLASCCGLIHRLDARRERSVHSPTAGHSGYAADDFPEAEHDSPYARYDMPFHCTEEVLDTPIRHPPIIVTFWGTFITALVRNGDAFQCKTFDARCNSARFDPYMYALDGLYQNVTQVYLPVFFKNHWTLYVYDLHNKRIQLLDSRPGRKRSCMSGIQQKLAKVVLLLVADKKEMVAVDLNMYSFVMPDVPCQPNDNDCGVFIMKFMDNWSNGGLSKSIDVAKMKKYRLKLLGRLLLSSHNAHRHRFMAV